MRPERSDQSLQDIELEHVGRPAYPRGRPPQPGSGPWLWIIAVVFFGALVLGGVGLAAYRIRVAQEQREQEQVVVDEMRKLVEVTNEAGDAAKFEEVAARLEASAAKASADMRLLVSVMIPYHRELLHSLRSREKLVEKLDGISVLDGGALTSREIIQERVSLMREYAQINQRIVELAGDAPAELSSRVRASGASDAFSAEFRRGIDQGIAKQLPRERAFLSTAMKLRTAEKVWAEACVAALGVLGDEWGQWSWNAKTSQVLFQSEAGKKRFDDALRQVQGDEIVMQRREAERFVLDPANKIEPPSPAQLPSVRRGFATALLPEPVRARVPAQTPPRGVFERIRYRSPAGDLVAYITPAPKDGRPRPAVLWTHGGFDGIGSYLWDPAPAENDQSVRAFLDAGFVVMCPSVRGENDNPGRLELFYGEVEDILAARDHLAALAHVDADHIYLAGHSSGGTLTLLAAASTDRFRAAFSFGGAPDMPRVVGEGGYGNTPFDPKAEAESLMRSPTRFVGGIRRPTIYFEGGNSSYSNDALRMEALSIMAEKIAAAQPPGLTGPRPAPPRTFAAHIVRGGDHFDILRPLTRLVAKKIAEDTGATWTEIQPSEIQGAFDSARAAPSK